MRITDTLLSEASSSRSGYLRAIGQLKRPWRGTEMNFGSGLDCALRRVTKRLRRHKTRAGLWAHHVEEERDRLANLTDERF